MAARRAAKGLRPHRYEEYCPVSRALGVVGDRWTLLIVVELLFFPKRYSDLQAALTGISTNLLASRLKRLEETGVVRKRRLPPPAASTVYELTERGRLLEPVAFALGRFGLHYLDAPTRDLCLPLETWLFGLQLTFKPEQAEGLDEVYELRIDDHPPVQVVVRNGAVQSSLGPADDPAVIVTAKTPALLALCSRALSPTRAVRTRAVSLTGPRAAFTRFISLFEMPRPA